MGLQRALQLAGAQTAAATLWKVPDRATQVLMGRFYRHLWDTKNGVRPSKLAALRDAQLWLIDDWAPKHPEGNGRNAQRLEAGRQTFVDAGRPGFTLPVGRIRSLR